MVITIGIFHIGYSNKIIKKGIINYGNRSIINIICFTCVFVIMGRMISSSEDLLRRVLLALKEFEGENLDISKNIQE